MMMPVRQWLFLACLGIAAKAQSQLLSETETLFNLPPFTITFTSTHHEFVATGETNPFANIKGEIATITSSYLEDFFDLLLPERGVTYKHVEAVDLQVSAFQPFHYFREERKLQPFGDEGEDNRKLQQHPDDTHMGPPPELAFFVEVYGIAKFLQPTDANAVTSSRDQMKAILNQLMKDAFDDHSTNTYMARLKESTDLVLNGIETVDVVIPDDENVPPTTTSPPSSAPTLAQTEILKV